jgi:hypothetical protein
MKRILLAIIATGLSMTLLAQTDSTKTTTSDTIRVGGMVIIKKDDGTPAHRSIRITNKRSKKPSNISTNWWIIDIGANHLVDNTNYSSAEAQAFAPGFTKDNMDLTGKSINVNIWAFMQRLNLIKNVVNLKYGMGVELNNYRFDDKRVRFDKNPTQITLDPDLAGAKKNKLAADYLTVPVMMNFDFTPGKRKGFGLSAGVSAGYLYSARWKIKDDSKKTKLKDDFDLERWKLSYVGELNLGPVKLYGSYATRSMWKKGLDQTPYNVGIRLSSW